MCHICVKESQSSQSPQSPPSTHTRSNSPDYWSPPPVTSHQEHYINTLLPNSHCLVSNITCWITWASYRLSTLSSFLCFDPRSPPSPSSIAPAGPLDKVKDWLLTDKTLWNFSIPVSLTWTRCIASFPCHSSINRQLISLTSVYLICWQWHICVF